MPDGERLFFALWPPAGFQDSVVARTRAFVGSKALAVASRDLHVTLAFPGNSNAAQRACYEQAASAVRGTAFRLQLDQLGQWPKARVLWLAPSTVPAALTALVQNLNVALSSCGFVPEARAYRPHMTLARKYPGAFATTPVEPLGWLVEQLVLVVSERTHAAARYRVVAAWPLSQGGASGGA